MKFRIFVELKGKESLRKKKKKKESAIRIEREWREIRRGCEHTGGTYLRATCCR